MTTTNVDVVVVGGGLAGLVASATAARAGASVIRIERAEGAGRASTDERGGFLLSRGAHALYRGGEAEAVLDRLGVAVTGGIPPTKGSLGLLGDDLHLLPVGGSSLVRTGLVGLRDKARLGALLARLPKLDPSRLAGLTVDEWLVDNGLDGVAADLVRALVRVTSYVAASDLLAADAAVRQLQMAFALGVRYLDGGWERMAAGIGARAKAAGAEVVHAAVTAVEASTCGVEVALGAERTVAAGAVVVAAGPPAINGALLPGGPPPGWDAAGPEVAAACLDLGLVAPPQHRFILGIDRPLYFSLHHPPADLAPDGGAVAHAMRYLHPDDRADATATRAELHALAATAGLTASDVAVERHLHRMVVSGGTPTPEHGGLEGRPGVRIDGHDGVFVAGDWVGPVGMLADAALASGEAAGAAAARHASAAPARA
jgi:phytoene dehydrogenase-like protein